MQSNKGDAYQINATGAKHHGEAILVQPTTYHTKAVVGDLAQGVADPPAGAAEPPLAMVVAWKHAKAVGARDAPRISSSTALSTV